MCSSCCAATVLVECGYLTARQAVLSTDAFADLIVTIHNAAIYIGAEDKTRICVMLAGKRCSANPTAAAPANTLGWSGCVNLPVGDETCRAACNSTYAFQSPVAPTARCMDTDTWSYEGACIRE